jgi:5-formyltetrahydrofolate cyclo-ligase
MSGNPEFLERLAKYDVGIGYNPTSMEVSPFEFLPTLSTKVVYTIQPVASLVPAEVAQKAREFVANSSAFILVPGRRFDATGTRHGKGAGWYDRFLSIVPKEWFRIGFCYDDQFSEEPLVRQAWDQPMDVVYVVNKTSNEMRIYWTHARFPD